MITSNRGGVGIVLAGAAVGLIVGWAARRLVRSSPRPAAAVLSSFTTVLFDVDGTLIDSNAAHAETWAQALREHGLPCSAADIRPLVGMGTDKFLPRVAGIEESSPRGHAVTQRKKALFVERLPHLRPTPGARALLAFLREAHKTIVIATSADDREMDALLRQAGVADLIRHRSSKDDADSSKPDPDIVLAALKKARAAAREAVMIGDTPYDVEAARRARVSSIALRCGGYWRDADFAVADAIADNPGSLLRRWRRSAR